MGCGSRAWWLRSRLKDHLFFFGAFNPSYNAYYDRFADMHGVTGLPVLPQATLGQYTYEFAKPVRIYRAMELETTKSFSKSWQWRMNYRWAELLGNYEGAFRNDNAQSDPSISSLFDFTQGKLGLLGDQFVVGNLNTTAAIPSTTTLVTHSPARSSRT